MRQTKFATSLIVFLAFCFLASTIREASAYLNSSIIGRSLAEMGMPKEDILKDEARRIAPEFHVPAGLEKRVAFWFDVYSKYTSDDHVFHHQDNPWLIYSVISTKEVPENPKNRWAKFHKSEKIVKTERARIKKILLKLSRVKNYDNLKDEESRIYELLKEIPGKRSSVFRQASNDLRSQLGQKDFVVKGLLNSQRYLPYLEATFRERNLPVEITRLPLVESSFNEAAVSKVGASGIWQLMPSIGRKFLKMNDDFDERNSPVKATEAAAKLLAQNYKILKTWPLAITAYNHGPGGLLKAQKKLKTNDISTIVDDYSGSAFGFASSNFYSSFLAVLHVERYSREIFGDLPTKDFPDLKVVEMPQSVKLKDLTVALGLDFNELQSYNLDLKDRAYAKNRRLPKGFRLFIPTERQAQLETYLVNLPQAITQKENLKRSPRL